MAVRPERYRNAIVPHIYIDGAAAAIDFYERAFAAVELFRIARPDGRILHAELSISGSVVMLGDPDETLYGEPRKVGRCTAGLHLLLDDNAALARRAIEMGAQEIQPPTDMFYGASSASVRDPFGHIWVLLTWKEDLEPAEMERRGNALLKVAQSQPQPQPQPQAQSQPRARATARISVQSSEAKPYDRTVSPALLEIVLRETFSGDIQGESTVRALQTHRDDHSASMVSMQRVNAQLGGRRGTFVLQGSEIVADGKITATWFVVPGSGTGELAGLRGEGGFEGEFGKGSVGTLSYWFE